MTARLLTLLLLPAPLAACGVRGTAAADCSVAVRYDGVVYDGFAATEHPVSRLGRGELAACHDLGRDAPGSTFDETTPVRIVRLRGVDPAVAVGMRGPDYVTLLVAASLDPDRRDQLVRELG